MKKIYIIIINFNGEKNTLECLDSLKKVNKSDFELHTILADNDPENRINIDLNKFKEINLKLIENSENLGFSGGNNVGIKHALENNADYILIINNDTLVDKDFLQALFNFSEKTPDAGIVVPKIYFAKGYEFHKGRYKNDELGKVIWYAGGRMDWENVIGHHRGVDEVDKGKFEKIEETEFASGCCMLIRADVIRKVGMFDEKYFLYYEDSDLSQRVKKAGFNIIFLPKSIIWHKNAGSAGGSGSSLQDYYITRNRLLFGNRYAAIRAKIALNREGLKLVFGGRNAQKKGAKDYYLRRFGNSTHS